MGTCGISAGICTIRTMGTCRCSTMAKSTAWSKIYTCWISTGYRDVGTCLSLRATHPYKNCLDITDNNKRASTMGAATNVGDADLREDALQICLCANEGVDDLVQLPRSPAPSRPSAPVVAQQAGLCSTSGASPGRQQCWFALSAVAPASSRRLTAGTRTGWAIRRRHARAIHRQPEGGGPRCHF